MDGRMISRVKIDTGRELPEIVRILGDDNPIFGDGAREDEPIDLAQPTAVAGELCHEGPTYSDGG
jgi:hypothetical protein